MYKWLSNKEISTHYFRRFLVITLSMLSRIGTKTKPIQSQNEANFGLAPRLVLGVKKIMNLCFQC